MYPIASGASTPSGVLNSHQTPAVEFLEFRDGEEGSSVHTTIQSAEWFIVLACVSSSAAMKQISKRACAVTFWRVSAAAVPVEWTQIAVR